MQPVEYLIVLVAITQGVRMVSAQLPSGSYYSTAGGTSSTCKVLSQTICPAGQYNSNYNNTYAGDCLPCTGLVNGNYYIPNTISNLPVGSRCPTTACSDSGCSIGQYIAGCTGTSPGTCQNCNNANATQVYSGKGSWTGQCGVVGCPNTCTTGQYMSGCGGLASQTSCQSCVNTNTSVYINTIGGYTPGSCGTTDCPSCPIGQWRTGCAGISSGTCIGCNNAS